MTTTDRATTITDLQELYPGIAIPSFGQALELAAVELELNQGPKAHESFWNATADPEARNVMLTDYNQAVADHIAHWGAHSNTPVAERLALIFLAKQPENPDDPPPGWNWPVCDDCLDVAYGHNIRGFVEQADFMQTIGAELPDHLCEMALDPEDRGRNHCACACQNPQT